MLRGDLPTQSAAALTVACLPVQGAYKITRGLLQKYGPKRVRDTPITEVSALLCCCRCRCCCWAQHIAHAAMVLAAVGVSPQLPPCRHSQLSLPLPWGPPTSFLARLVSPASAWAPRLRGCAPSWSS